MLIPINAYETTNDDPDLNKPTYRSSINVYNIHEIWEDDGFVGIRFNNWNEPDKYIKDSYDFITKLVNETLIRIMKIKNGV